MKDLKEWVKSYVLDMLAGFVFWGALFCCILQGWYYWNEGQTGRLYLLIAVGILILAIGLYLLSRLWKKGDKTGLFVTGILFFLIGFVFLQIHFNWSDKVLYFVGFPIIGLASYLFITKCSKD